MIAERVAREGSSFCFSRSSLFSPTERCKRHLYEHSLSQSVAPQSNPSPKHFWPRLRCTSLRLKTAAVFGPIDCALRLVLRFTPTPLLRHGVGRVCLRLWLQTISDGYVPAQSRHLRKLRGRALSLRCQPATYACYFRLVLAAALLSFLWSAQAVAFLVPPTQRRLMNARSLAYGTRFIVRREQ